ncbi:MAG: TIGR01777 family oxidoreductase [Candidatus Electrothrix sp. YB6]
MKILVSGASGLVGSEVSRFLAAQGHQVLALQRKTTRPPYWDTDRKIIELGTDPADTGIDAVIHLAGENIAQGRWTAAKKERILRSRVDGTHLLAEFFASAEYRPRIIISASAVGFYGDRGAEQLDETAGRGAGFLADVADAWEKATVPAAEAGIRVVQLRFGMVLSPAGGGLAKMLPPFRLLGIGGPMGNGRQYMSWISIREIGEIILHVLEQEKLHGPVNAVAPHPVTNAQFTKILANVLRRPAFLPVPGFLLSLLFGEMARELVLASTRVYPAKLLESGYPFRAPELETALRNLLC